MYRLLRSVLFLLSAEKAHHITTLVAVILSKVPIVNSIITSFYRLEDKNLEREIWGLKFKNPVGLAAGFDKDGMYIEAMKMLGFGFIEVGTVTPLPQDGNPLPRLFRLVADQAIINRMGFNNKGVDFLVNRLKKLQKGDLIIGGNIGKNKNTTNEEAFKDYLICFEKLYPYVDYFVINISSPNTPGLRSLQEKEPLRKILSILITRRHQEAIKRPILLKIAPDLSDEALQDVIEIVEEQGIEGIIATNTTIERSPLSTDLATIQHIGSGGLSGKPLFSQSTSILSKVTRQTSLPIIGVGGIDSGLTAHEKMLAGAQLIQIYTGLIFQGPTLVKKIKRHLIKMNSNQTPSQT